MRSFTRCPVPVFHRFREELFPQIIDMHFTLFLPPRFGVVQQYHPFGADGIRTDTSVLGKLLQTGVLALCHMFTTSQHLVRAHGDAGVVPLVSPGVDPNLYRVVVAVGTQNFAVLVAVEGEMLVLKFLGGQRDFCVKDRWFVAGRWAPVFVWLHVLPHQLQKKKSRVVLTVGSLSKNVIHLNVCYNRVSILLHFL